MDLRLNNIYFEVQDHNKKAGISKPKVFVRYEVPRFPLELAKFDGEGALSFSVTNIRVRPRRHRLILVDVGLVGRFDPVTGNVSVDGSCNHNAASNISVRVVGYDLVAILTNRPKK